jgi:hypothetical protein
MGRGCETEKNRTNREKLLLKAVKFYIFTTNTKSLLAYRAGTCCPRPYF